MTNSTQLIRDKILLNQSFVTRLQQKAHQEQADTIVLTARQITVVEPVQLTNIDLIFVAENFNGNNQPITIFPPQRNQDELGQAGYTGKKITILAKNVAYVSAILNGSDGVVGAKGDPGPDALPLDYDTKPPQNIAIPGSIGGKGKQGGAAGNGGSLLIRSVNPPSINIESIVLNSGNPQIGGPGGIGGIGQLCTVERSFEEFDEVRRRVPGGGNMTTQNVYQKCIPHIWGGNPVRATTGDIGDMGSTGTKGEIIQTVITEDEWYKEVIQISPNWSDYRTKVGEYFFRAVNNTDLQISLNLDESTQVISLALDELDIARNKLDPANETAKVISDRIKVLHTPLGFSRSIDIVPDFEDYEKAYLGYYNVVAEIRKIAENYFNIADIKNNIETVLHAESASVLAYQQAIIVNLNSKIKYLQKQKQDDIDQRLKTDQELSDKIEARKQFLANQGGGIGFAEILAYAEVVVAVVGAIYTAGATLVAAAQGLMTIAKSGSKMIDAIEEIKSIKEAKTAIGEFIDVAKGKKKPKDTTHEKLISSADDFSSAIGKFDKDANKFKDSVEIILNINKAISQIKGTKTGDAELDNLLGQKADNMHEVLIAKKDLELLGYDEVVANLQIKAYDLVAEQINNQASAMQAGSSDFLLQFAVMMKRSQFYMDFLIEQVFYAIRSLEILEFADLSNLIRYDYGYFHPDLEADLNQLNDQESAKNLLIAYNKSMADFASVTAYRTNYNKFMNKDSWSPYTYKLKFDKDQIKDFVISPQSAILRFTIDPLIELTNASGTLTDKSYVILQSVKISFVGVKTQDLSDTFNATFYQSGALYQRTYESKPVSIVLRGRRANINDVQTKLLTNVDLDNSAFGYNSDFNLSYRSVFSYYEISVPKSEFISGNLDFLSLSQIQVWFKVYFRI